MNKVFLKGNLTRDPELRYTPKGKAVAKLGIAVNEKWKDQNGEPMERTDFFDCESWDKQAELIAQYFKKGKPILIEGKLVQETWDDKQTGQKRYAVKVRIQSFEFCGDNKPQSEAERTEQAHRRAEAPQPDPAPSHDDDVPF